MLLTLIISSLVLDTSLSASLHWEIDWSNAVNSYGTYATKSLIPRLKKLDGIIQQRVTELKDEIDELCHTYDNHQHDVYSLDYDPSRLLHQLQAKS